ncbi:helix-turn-helix domain-containing protein [Moheibacter sp.]|uniref:helix-turn-helix domain-containing protein n=1 Tax=Moheibacter sp. TaxID=1965316 RepID=UPI003C7565DC
MYHEILNTLILLGALQGLFFTAIALSMRKFKSKSTFFIAMLILCFSLNNIQYYLWETDIIDREIFFGIVYFPYASLSMVLYYFYVKLFLYPKNPIKKKQWLLFLPCSFFFLLTSYYKIGNAFGDLSGKTEIFFSYLIYVHEIFSVLFSIILLGCIYALILNFEKNQLKGKTQIPKIGVNWLKIISLISFILCLIWIISIYDELTYGSDNVSFYYILWLGMSFTIYILGHIGLYRFGILQEQKSIQKFSNYNKTMISVEAVYSQNEHIEEFEKYIKTEKNYLDSNLSLESVAEKLNINKSYLSRIINSELEKSFTDYVNELRVEEAKFYMTNPEFKNYTLISIGLEAGFNSKSAFNTAFKKFTGMTPSQFKNSLV